MVAVMDLDQRTAYSCLAWHNFPATGKAYPPLDLKKISLQASYGHTQKDKAYILLLGGVLAAIEWQKHFTSL